MKGNPTFTVKRPSVTTGLNPEYQRVAEMQKTERIGAGKAAAGKEKRHALTFLTFSICKIKLKNGDIGVNLDNVRIVEMGICQDNSCIYNKLSSRGGGYFSVF